MKDDGLVSATREDWCLAGLPIVENLIMKKIKAWVNKIKAWVNLKTHRIEGRSYFALDDGLSFIFIVLGVMGFIDGPIPYVSFWTDLFISLRSVMIGIGLTVLIITNANDWMNRRAEKDQLILQMGSPYRYTALEAIRQLRVRGWIKDGSLFGANLHNANLSGADLEEANLKGVNLNGANLSGAELKGANLNGAHLEEINLSGANLNGSNLNRANLRKAILSRTNLTGVDLTRADLSWADVTLARLSEADLEGVNLFEANLNGADLTLANLRSAHLRFADLSEASLRRADLSGADLSGADLSGAGLSGAIFSKNTIRMGGWDTDRLRRAGIELID